MRPNNQTHIFVVELAVLDMHKANAMIRVSWRQIMKRTLSGIRSRSRTETPLSASRIAAASARKTFR